MKNGESQDKDKQIKSFDTILDNDIHNFKPFIININYNKRSLDSLIDLKKKHNESLDVPFKRSLDSLLDYVNILIKENIDSKNYLKKKKSKNRSIRRSISNYQLYRRIDTINIKAKINKSFSETNIKSNYIKELKKEKNDKKINKNVSFNESVSVILIPTKLEYINHNLKDILWYSSTDYIKFKNECLFKIRNNFEVYNLKSFSVDSPIITKKKL